MNHKEHKEYLKDFKDYSKEILETKESSQEFLIRIGVNTPTGKLTRAYSQPVSSSNNRRK